MTSTSDILKHLVMPGDVKNKAITVEESSLIPTAPDLVNDEDKKMANLIEQCLRPGNHKKLRNT